MDTKIKLFALFVAFITPLLSLIHVIMTLLLVDMVTSIYSQMKQAVRKNGDKGMFARLKTSLLVIESDKLRRTIEKMVFYILTIFAFYLFDRYVLQINPTAPDAIYTFSSTNISVALMCMVELTSIASNVSNITGNPVFNTIARIINKKVKNKYEIDDEESDS